MEYNMFEKPVMLTVNQTAEAFGIAKHYARQLALTGRVKAIRAGNKILINAASVAEFFNTSTLNDDEQTEYIKPIPAKIGGIKK